MRFFNLYPVAKYLKDPYGERRGTAPRRPDHPLSGSLPDFKSVCSEGLSYAWLGHSSVFLRMNGESLLIDPVFSSHVSPYPPFGPKRYPGVVPNAGDFPEIELVLITHNHYDHLDQGTIRALIPIVKHFLVPRALKETMVSFGIPEDKVTELSWGEKYHTPGLTITCMPAHHNSVRGLRDRDQTLWCSYVISDGNTTAFHSGDTAFSEHFQEIHRAFPAFDLILMECGQYGDSWHNMHMFPEESVEACRILCGRLSVPIHWGAYTLSTHPWNDPPIRFERRAQEVSLPYRIPQLCEIVTI